MTALRNRAAQGNQRPIFWTPTIQVLWNYDYLRDHPEDVDDPSWKVGLPDSIVQDIAKSIAQTDRIAYYQMVSARGPTLKRKFEQLRGSGATLLIGTDAGVPTQFHSQTTWRELEAWVNGFGVDPMTAIRAATFWPAVAMRVENQVGTVSPGKYADIIAVRGDVLRHIALLSDPRIVMKRGVVVRR